MRKRRLDSDEYGLCIGKEGVIHDVDENLQWAAAVSFGSGWSFDRASIMNAELTAENNPTCTAACLVE